MTELEMTEDVAHTAIMASWRSLTRDRAATAALADIEGPVPRSTARIDPSRLDEVAAPCGYDAHCISRHFGISVRQLQRWFTTHLSCTPGAWLSERRLQDARRLLAASNSVKEVAYSLGFKQASQFSRDFKRRFGHQPSTELARERIRRGIPPR
jgi:AraC-like DNA-binding protein